MTSLDSHRYSMLVRVTEFGAAHRDTFNAMTELAISYRVAGRTKEAIELEREALRLKRQHLPVGHPMTAESMENLATCYEQLNMKTEADALRQELAELGSKRANSSLPIPTKPEPSPKQP